MIECGIVTSGGLDISIANEIWGGAKRGANDLLEPMYRDAFLDPPAVAAPAPAAPRVTAALAADTAFAHVLGEGVAAAPWRPGSDHCGLHAISALAA